MPWLVALAGAALTGVVGVLVGSAGLTGAGSLAVLALLAVHPVVRDRGVPRSTRLLLRGGLLLVAAAVAIEIWAPGLLPSDPVALIAMVNDPRWEQDQFLRQLAVAVCLILACAAFAVAVGRSARDHPNRAAVAASMVGGLTLGALAWFAADAAWRSRPEPRPETAFYSVGVAVASGPDVAAAVALLVLLLGTAVTVLACARLRTT